MPALSRAEEPLSFDDCIIEAVNKNPELRAAELTLKGSRLLKRSAEGGYYPNLSIQASGGRGSGGSNGLDGSDSIAKPLDDLSSETFNTDGETNSYSSQSINLSQVVFDGFAVEAQVDNAMAQINRSSALLRSAKAKLSYDLKSAFSSMIYGQDFVRLSREIIGRRKENFDIVDLRFESGHENKGSVLLSRAYLSEAKYDSLQAADSLKLAKESLAKVIGRKDSDALSVKGSVPSSSPPLSPDFESLSLDAPDYEKSLSDIDSAKASLKSAKSKRLPTIDLRSDFGYLQTDFENNKDRWNIGLTAAMPIFSGGEYYYAVQSSHAQKLSAESAARSIQKSAILRLKETYSAFIEALEREKVDRDYAAAESVRAEIARAKYNNGLLSFEDWDLIENNLINRKKTLLSSVRARVIAEAAFEETQGKGVIP